ncbi:MAG: hypothetical protein ACREDF_01435 [Thermoplasmata archaeon]
MDPEPNQVMSVAVGRNLALMLINQAELIAKSPQLFVSSLVSHALHYGYQAVKEEGGIAKADLFLGATLNLIAMNFRSSEPDMTIRFEILRKDKDV